MYRSIVRRPSSRRALSRLRVPRGPYRGAGRFSCEDLTVDRSRRSARKARRHQERQQDHSRPGGATDHEAPAERARDEAAIADA